MKGFIEVTNTTKEFINIRSIDRVFPYINGKYKSKLVIGEGTVSCEESYEEIKALIKSATEV